MTSAARHQHIVALYEKYGTGKAARMLRVSPDTVYYHANGWQCRCLPKSGSQPRTCTTHGHAERPGPWGPHCRYCGVALPERGEHKDGVGDVWVALGKGRVWVPA